LVNPGFCRSQLFRNIPWPFGYIVTMGLAVLGRTAEVGARTLVVAAAAGKETHGKYMNSCKVYEVSRFVASEKGGELQMRVYEELTGILEAVEPGVAKNACRD
jgi:retinol dehydrogenase-12